jgi:hypothetical protein
MVGACETSQTENFIVSNTWAIQAGDATYVPGLPGSDTGTCVYTVDVLAGTREHHAR